VTRARTPAAGRVRWAARVLASRAAAVGGALSATAPVTSFLPNARIARLACARVAVLPGTALAPRRGGDPRTGRRPAR